MSKSVNEKMEKRDIELIRVLQREELFLTPNPFKKAAELLHWEPREVLERSMRLRDSGVIRRFGAALTPRNAGFKANAMVAWDVEKEREFEVADAMANHPRISHCYIRPRFKGFPFNLYTMIHANSPEDLKTIVAELSEATEVKAYRVLKSLKEFKKTSPVYFP